MEVSEGPAEKGLSLLVQQVLGKPLNKSEQLSNWERRPLRTSQLCYAGNKKFMWKHDSFEPSPILFLYLFSAADAYCLLDVYLVLSRDPKAFGLPEDLCSIPSQPARKREEKKPKEKNKQSKRREVSSLVCQSLTAIFMSL